MLLQQNIEALPAVRDVVGHRANLVIVEHGPDGPEHRLYCLHWRARLARRLGALGLGDGVSTLAHQGQRFLDRLETLELPQRLDPFRPGDPFP
jgi:hypothetical protein